MASEKQTTVNLSKKALEIKIDLAPIFGLKNILSAGLVLLNKLSTEDQKRVIEEAKGLSIEEPLQISTDESVFRERVLKILKDSQEIPAEKKRGKKAKSSKSA
jgi:hypothetical protein